MVSPRRRWPERALGLGCGLAVAGLAAGLLTAGFDSAGAASSQLDLQSGTAWFASPSTGRVSMIDGPTATRVVVKDAAVAGHDLEMIQAGDDGFVVDRTDATMRRVDSGTFVVGAPVVIGTPGDALLDVRANDRAVWVIAQNGTVVQQFDPNRGTPIGDPMPFPGKASSSAVAPDGTLWTIDSNIGLVRAFHNSAIRADRRLAMSVDTTIVLVDDEPVLVDAGGNALRILDPQSGRVKRSTCLDIPPNVNAETVGSSSTGSPWVVGVLSDQGTTQIADIDTNTCLPVAIGAPASALSFGAPVAHGQRVFVPDLTNGTVVVIEPSASPERVIARINLGLAGHKFELFDHHSFVWFDDIDTDTAGVIRDDLTALIVNKIQGDGLPTPPPDAVDNTPKDDLPQPSCAASPNPAQPGQPVVLNGAIDPVGTNVIAWNWTIPDAVPNTAVGAQANATWTTPGPRTVVLTVTVAKTASTTIDVTANCLVNISDLVPESTTTTTPNTIAPPTTPPPSPEVPPAGTTTTTAVPSAGATTTTTIAPPITPPPIVVAPPTGTTTTIPSATPIPPPIVTPTVPPVDPSAASTTSAPDTTTTSAPATTTTSPTSTTSPVPTTIPTPVPDFTWTPMSPAAGQAVTFTDTSSATPDQWSWSFPGGLPGNSTAQTPAPVTFANPGTYTVALTVTYNGSAYSVQRDIFIGTNRYSTATAPSAFMMSNAPNDYQIVTGASVTVPPGTYMIEGRASVSGSAVTDAGAVTYVRCGIFDGTTFLDVTVAVVTPGSTGMTIPILALATVPTTSSGTFSLGCGHDETVLSGNIVIDAGARIIATRADESVIARQDLNTTLTAAIAFTLPTPGSWLIRAKAAIISYQNTATAGPAFSFCRFNGGTLTDSDQVNVGSDSYGLATSLAEPIDNTSTSFGYEVTCDASNVDSASPPYMDGGAKAVAIKVAQWAQQLNFGMTTLPPNVNQDVVTLGGVGTGTWLVQGKANLNATGGDSNRVTCQMRTQAGTVIDSAGVDVNPGSRARPVLLMAVVNNPTGITMSCQTAGAATSPPSASPGARIMVTKVDIAG